MRMMNEGINRAWNHFFPDPNSEPKKPKKTVWETIKRIKQSEQDKYNEIMDERNDLEASILVAKAIEVRPEDKVDYENTMTKIAEKAVFNDNDDKPKGYLKDLEPQRLKNSYLKAVNELKTFAEEVYDSNSNSMSNAEKRVARKYIDKIADEINNIKEPLQSEDIKRIRQQTDDLRVACGKEPRKQKSVFRKSNLKEAGLLLLGIAVCSVFPPLGVAIIAGVVGKFFYDKYRAMRGFDEKWKDQQKARQRVDPDFEKNLTLESQRRKKVDYGFGKKDLEQLKSTATEKQTLLSFDNKGNTVQGEAQVLKDDRVYSGGPGSPGS